MSRFIKDDKSIMSLTLSQIGLIIATGILIVAIFSIIFFNDWQKNAEIKNIATSFTTTIQAMDSRFFENTTKFQFPEKNYNYNISISTEYIIISTEGSQNKKLSIKERFIINPWPRFSDQEWKTGQELHNYCYNNFGHSGTNADPITQDASNILKNEKVNQSPNLALNPLYIQIKSPVYIEKVNIYCDTGYKQEYIIIYQKE